mmetsp:Transcript_32227/g.79850  ORF Transcript_32227/g.79850 Transcript_32227/m.79850 type:complete len:208 (-) Transcript_32227:713-1336(-)
MRALQHVGCFRFARRGGCGSRPACGHLCRSLCGGEGLGAARRCADADGRVGSKRQDRRFADGPARAAPATAARTARRLCPRTAPRCFCLSPSLRRAVRAAGARSLSARGRSLRGVSRPKGRRPHGGQDSPALPPRRLRAPQPGAAPRRARGRGLRRALRTRHPYRRREPAASQQRQRQHRLFPHGRCAVRGPTLPGRAQIRIRHGAL